MKAITIYMFVHKYVNTHIVIWYCTDVPIINSNIMKYHEILKSLGFKSQKKIIVVTNVDDLILNSNNYMYLSSHLTIQQ